MESLGQEFISQELFFYHIKLHLAHKRRTTTKEIFQKLHTGWIKLEVTQKKIINKLGKCTYFISKCFD